MQISFVRRLDELGRIVIPKEIRNNLNFNAGDLLDLNIGSDTLIIRRSNSTFNKNYIDEIISIVEYLSDYDIILTDNDKVIAKSSKLSNILLESNISNELKNLILEHKSEDFIMGVYINENEFLNGKVYVKALIKDSNMLGLLILRVKNDVQNINLFLNMLAKLLLQ